MARRAKNKNNDQQQNPEKNQNQASDTKPKDDSPEEAKFKHNEQDLQASDIAQNSPAEVKLEKTAPESGPDKEKACPPNVEDPSTDDRISSAESIDLEWIRAEFTAIRKRMSLLQEIQDSIIEILSMRHQPPVKEIFDPTVLGLPIPSKERFVTFIDQLLETGHRAQLVRHLSECGGERPDKLIRRIWRRLLTQDYLITFNWSGLQKTILLKIVKDATRLACPQATDDKIISTTKKYFNKLRAEQRNLPVAPEDMPEEPSIHELPISSNDALTTKCNLPVESEGNVVTEPSIHELPTPSDNFLTTKYAIKQNEADDNLPVKPEGNVVMKLSIHELPISSDDALAKKYTIVKSEGDRNLPVKPEGNVVIEPFFFGQPISSDEAVKPEGNVVMEPSFYGLPIASDEALNAFMEKCQDINYKTPLVQHLSNCDGINPKQLIPDIWRRIIAPNYLKNFSWFGINGQYELRKSDLLVLVMEVVRVIVPEATDDIICTITRRYFHNLPADPSQIDSTSQAEPKHIDASLFGLPIGSNKKMIALQMKLKDINIRKQLLRLLGECAAENTELLVGEMWQQLMMPEYQSRFTWSGLKGPYDLKNSMLLPVVKDAAKLVFPQATDDEICTATKIFFKHNCDKEPEPEPVFDPAIFDLPIGSNDTMDNIITHLKKVDNQHQLVRILCECDGKTADIMVRAIWRRLLAPDYQKYFSWFYLRSKFESVVLFKYVRDATVTKFPQATNEEIFTTTKSFFHKFRSGPTRADLQNFIKHGPNAQYDPADFLLPINSRNALDALMEKLSDATKQREMIRHLSRCCGENADMLSRQMWQRLMGPDFLMLYCFNYNHRLLRNTSLVGIVQDAIHLAYPRTTDEEFHTFTNAFFRAQASLLQPELRD